MLMKLELDKKIFLRNYKEALKWKIFKEHRLANFEEIFKKLIENEKNGNYNG